MKTDIITSVKNPKIQEYKKLLMKKYRDKMALFIVEGMHLVQEAQNAQVVHEILTTDTNYPGTLVSSNVLKVLTTTHSPSHIIAVCKKIIPKSLGQKVLALSSIQDPGNVGTLIRTAASFAYDSVLVNGVDIYNPKVLRASQGAIFHINIIVTDDITKYFGKYQTIGAILDKNAQNYQEIIPQKPFMIILGNEGSGLSQEFIKKIDYKVYIPIHFESLNVAVAGAILLNHYQDT